MKGNTLQALMTLTKTLDPKLEPDILFGAWGQGWGCAHDLLREQPKSGSGMRHENQGTSLLCIKYVTLFSSLSLNA